LPRLHGERAGHGSAPLNYAPPGHRPYPKSICTSVNHQVCHGVPGDKVLKQATS
jgi:methionyl aminopeptidase